MSKGASADADRATRPTDQAATRLGDSASVPSAARALLAKVLDYYEGREPFDFHRLPDEQRANEAFDAWLQIATEIRAELAQ